ncbi:adenylyltransferase/cytidyltransferase family protein [Picrophilus oshimae]|uniref:FAD synthase n=1 Tax=Picrophilus torridus (strain ATCC 700027 / DSM 9790 / JCM 10055 / NBRC 100828 / KAW 2/3) TaxID=1122961 RepID=RIBL_PICTO|nr:adenylyltransferase/cytidyltransferase family protein [Picrophilus oshimae]Q6L0A7.1 RecName: Full=FAD synthase; AltName: Full=FMN adenylyltransferase; AltName: Full=Flavin adenine dinucleotide synthase [Picrophilus oshimae DSM 9789]AAT43595.1 glycerol-3-phosphate cytidylyltransferase [Picrophilus oshimae DSM 9789]
MKIMATGVFDILHPGHIHYLSESKKLGDYLIVIIATDKTAGSHGKKLIFNEEQRRFMVSQLRMVDEAIIGHEDDIFKTVYEVRPDIITLGYDQHFNDSEIEKKCRDLGLNTRVVRISKYDGEIKSSSDIRRRIIELYNR